MTIEMIQKKLTRISKNVFGRDVDYKEMDIGQKLLVCPYIISGCRNGQEVIERAEKLGTLIDLTPLQIITYKKNPSLQHEYKRRDDLVEALQILREREMMH